MNFENQDHLDRLKANWDDIPSPRFEDGDDFPKDSETRQCVAWMQSAWQEIEVPQFAPKKKPLQLTPFLRVFSSVAAAIVLAAITIWTFGGTTELEKSSTRLGAYSQQEIENQTTVEVAESGTMTTTMREQGGLLLRKGRVKLILVQPTVHTTIDKESKK